MGLLDLYAGKKLDRFKKPNGLLNYAAENPKEVAGLLADFTPVVGDLRSAYDGIQAAREGDMLGAGLGALGALPFMPNIAASVTKPEGTTAIVGLLSDGVPGELKQVGTLEANHAKTWGKGETELPLFFGEPDVIHTEKRMREGITPDEIAEIGFRATLKNAHAKKTGKGDLLLQSPIKMKFDDSPLFSPQALIRMNGDQAHLYGVVPKGWKGRK